MLSLLLVVLIFFASYMIVVLLHRMDLDVLVLVLRQAAIIVVSMYIFTRYLRRKRHG